MVLGLVLAPMLGMSLRQSLAVSGGHYAIFVTRPISVTMLLAAAALLILSLRPLLARGVDWRRRMGLDTDPSLGEETP